MEKWAKKYSNVLFLAVCVDSLGVAKQFGAMFGFEKVVNCHIPSQGYMPRGYRQLGCSGFIVADESGCFVSRRTIAYLDYDEDAFRFVEDLLSKRFGITPSRKAVPSSEKAEKVEEKKIEEENLDKAVPSVGIASMDSEHEKCERALSLLLAKPNSQTLENALVELTSHFAHEEQLMKTYGFGKADSTASFSPFASHVDDHERILQLGYAELAKATTKAQENMVCSKGTKS